MEDLKDIIKEVKSYKSKDFKPSDDAILTCATMIFLDGEKKQNTSGQKPKSNSPKKNKSFKIKDPTAPATDAQKKKLDELKVKYPNNLTKGEADQLIKESIKKGSSQEEYADY
jgi:hypothetical protein